MMKDHDMNESTEDARLVAIRAASTPSLMHEEPDRPAPASNTGGAT